MKNLNESKHFVQKKDGFHLKDKVGSLILIVLEWK
jgi:hypothetical protein